MRARIFSRLGFSVCGMIFSPEGAKRFFRNARRSVIFRPRTHRIKRRAVKTETVRGAQRHPRQTAHESKARGAPHGPLPDFETDPFGPGASGVIHRVTPIFEKVVVEIDFHRASIGARAAKRRCVGEMLKFVEPAQMGSENAADRSRVSGAV